MALEDNLNPAAGEQCRSESPAIPLQPLQQSVSQPVPPSVPQAAPAPAPAPEPVPPAAAKSGILARAKSCYADINFGGEFFGLFGSLLALIAIAIFMGNLNGRELPDWSISHVHFTINSFLAIIYTFGLTCAMIPIYGCLSQLKYVWFVGKSRSLADLDIFDSATRGKMGSVKLIWRLKFKSVPTDGHRLDG